MKEKIIKCKYLFYKFKEVKLDEKDNEYLLLKVIKIIYIKKQNFFFIYIKHFISLS